MRVRKYLRTCELVVLCKVGEAHAVAIQLVLLRALSSLPILAYDATVNSWSTATM